RIMRNPPRMLMPHRVIVVKHNVVCTMPILRSDDSVVFLKCDTLNLCVSGIGEIEMFDLCLATGDVGLRLNRRQIAMHSAGTFTGAAAHRSITTLATQVGVLATLPSAMHLLPMHLSRLLAGVFSLTFSLFPFFCRRDTQAQAETAHDDNK